MPNRRIATLDAMTGIAMLLVVLAHHRFYYMPEWYEQLYYCTYIFHMPLFITLSGFLIRYSYKGVIGWGGYRKYVWRKFTKFFPPYFLIGAAVTTFISIPHFNLAHYAESILNLLISPKRTETIFLWYIYMLTVLYAVSPLVFRLGSKMRLLLFAVLAAITVYCSDKLLTDLFCFECLVRFAPFYMLGVIMAENINYIRRVPRKYILFFSSLVSLVFIGLIGECYSGYHKTNELLIPYLSIPFAYLLAQAVLHNNWVRKLFEAISRHCFVIYLLHMFFVQLIALIVVKSGGLPNTAVTVAYIILSTAISMSAPVLVSKGYDAATAYIQKRRSQC